MSIHEPRERPGRVGLWWRAPFPGAEEVAVLTMRQAASEFLAAKRIGVTGVSKTPQGHGANLVFRRLRDRGYEAFAINPNADQVEGARCYQDLRSVPGGVDAVVIGTRPEIAEDTMRVCVELGVKYVWMHRLYGTGSVSEAATQYGRQHGITVMDGGCPLMLRPHRRCRAQGAPLRVHPDRQGPEAGVTPVRCRDPVPVRPQ